MRKQRRSSSAVSIWKVLLIVLVLFCGLRLVQGGRDVSMGYPGPRPNTAGSYYRDRPCNVAYGCYEGPPAKP
uniref:Uncharacterized protein n=1 Tax=Oryza punctata TaxID=4537 RepID=A0A0E0MB03_ORYPU